MTIETLQTISFICFLLASVFFLISVAMFFILNITKVVGDLSGINAKKAIENIRSQNDMGVKKKKKNETIQQKSQNSMSTKLKRSGAQGFAQTSKLNTSKLTKETAETTVISGADGNAAQTTVLMPSNTQETTVLGASAAETTVLSAKQDNKIASPTNVSVAPKVFEFIIDYEIWYTASTEIIT